MRIRSILATLAAGALVGSTALSAAPAQASAPPILFGLISPWSGSTMTTPQDDNQLGIRSGIIGSFFHWEKQAPDTGPLTNWLTWAHDRGAVPMPDLYPPTTVTLGQIAAGGQDKYLRPIAAAMRDWGNSHTDASGLPSQVLFRLLPEMNGNWESYAPRTRGQTAAQFRAAWIHVVNVFRAAGASNVKWVWNPYRFFTGEISYRAIWPGASYVNWVALDGYNFVDSTHPFRWPYALFSDSVSRIRSFAPAKPLLIAEIGCRQIPRKADWINAVPAAMHRLGAKAVVWFNESGSINWRVDSSGTSLTAARTVTHSADLAYAGTWSLARIDQLVNTGS